MASRWYTCVTKLYVFDFINMYCKPQEKALLKYLNCTYIYIYIINLLKMISFLTVNSYEAEPTSCIARNSQTEPKHLSGTLNCIICPPTSTYVW